MSAPSNDEDSGGNARPLARKKSSKSRFGLVQKFHDAPPATLPSSSCSEILSALSIEEREFVQGLVEGGTRRNTRTDRRASDRPQRMSREADRHIVGRINSHVLQPRGPAASIIRDRSSQVSLRKTLWKIFLTSLLFIVAFVIGQRNVENSGRFFSFIL